MTHIIDRRPICAVDLAYNSGRADFLVSLQQPTFDLLNPYDSMDQAEKYDAWDRAVMDALSES